MNESLVATAAAAAAASTANDDGNNNDNLAVEEEEEEGEEKEDKESVHPKKKKRKTKNKFKRHQVKGKQSKTTPQYIVRVIGEIRSGSNNKSPHSTTANDTITSLRNQIHYNNIIVQ